MIEIEFDAASVARVRVGYSPLFEVVAWLSAVATGARHPVVGDPGAAARFALRDRAVARIAFMLAVGAAQRSIPDYLTPKPPRDARFQDQLAAVEQTPSDLAHAQLPDGLPVELAPDVVADGLTKFWRTAVADVWPSIERALADNVRRCGATLASGGVAGLFAAQPAMHWTGHSLVVDKPRRASISLRDTELVLVPSVLTTLPVFTQIADPADTFLSVTAGSEIPQIEGPALLGRSRTRVLTALRTPATTRTLARSLSLSEPTVSHHLHALARAGLTTATREGREVVYTRTPLGHELSANLPDRTQRRPAQS